MDIILTIYYIVYIKYYLILKEIFRFFKNSIHLVIHSFIHTCVDFFLREQRLNCTQYINYFMI